MHSECGVYMFGETVLNQMEQLESRNIAHCIYCKALEIQWIFHFWKS